MVYQHAAKSYLTVLFCQALDFTHSISLPFYLSLSISLFLSLSLSLPSFLGLFLFFMLTTKGPPGPPPHSQFSPERTFCACRNGGHQITGPDSASTHGPDPSDEASGSTIHLIATGSSRAAVVVVVIATADRSNQSLPTLPIPSVNERPSLLLNTVALPGK